MFKEIANIAQDLKDAFKVIAQLEKINKELLDLCHRQNDEIARLHGLTKPTVH